MMSVGCKIDMDMDDECHIYLSSMFSVTYLTNRYDIPFAHLVGESNHG
jgi:hypothetical protein